MILREILKKDEGEYDQYDQVRTYSVVVNIVNVNTTVLIESTESHLLFGAILPAEERWTG